MEIKFGEIFEYDGVKLKVVESKDRTCGDCYFRNYECCNIKCIPLERKDKKNVVFQMVDYNNSTDGISCYLELQRKFNFLKEIADEYPGKTIDYIIEQIKTRMDEN